MQLENEFEVALPPAEAWEVLLDIERIAPCMPGAELTGIVDDHTDRGKVSVRPGPVAHAARRRASEALADAPHRRRAPSYPADRMGDLYGS